MFGQKKKEKEPLANNFMMEDIKNVSHTLVPPKPTDNIDDVLSKDHISDAKSSLTDTVDNSRANTISQPISRNNLNRTSASQHIMGNMGPTFGGIAGLRKSKARNATVQA